MAIPPPPTYTPLPPAPDVDAGKAAFNNAANLFVPALPTFGTQLNAIAAWIEDRAEDIETAAGAVEDDATSAAASAAAAEGFKDDAEIAAAAAGAAAGLPAITGKPGYVLRVNLDADGVEFDLGASFAGQRAAYGGTANAITLTTGRAISGTPPAGLAVRFRATAANTGATTIALDGGSAVACRTVTGVALPAGYVRTGVETEAVFDGTFWVLSRKAEVGSNANGRFLRLENGYMEVSKALTALGPVNAANGNVFFSGNINVGTLAAEFADPPEASGAINRASFGGWLVGNAAATTTAGGVFNIGRATTSPSTDYGATFIFTGRWY